MSENHHIFLESLDRENITLIVGDWGGPIGLSYAINHPEKIKNIVLTNTWLWSAKNDWYYQAFSGFVGGAIGCGLIRKYNFFDNTVLMSIYGDLHITSRELNLASKW